MNHLDRLLDDIEQPYGNTIDWTTLGRLASCLSGSSAAVLLPEKTAAQAVAYRAASAVTSRAVSFRPRSSLGNAQRSISFQRRSTTTLSNLVPLPCYTPFECPGRPHSGNRRCLVLSFRNERTVYFLGNRVIAALCILITKLS